MSDAQLGERCFRNSPFHLLWCWRATTSPKYGCEVTGFARISPALVQGRGKLCRQLPAGLQSGCGMTPCRVKAAPWVRSYRSLKDSWGQRTTPTSQLHPSPTTPPAKAMPAVPAAPQTSWLFHAHMNQKARTRSKSPKSGDMNSPAPRWCAVGQVLQLGDKER